MWVPYKFVGSQVNFNQSNKVCWKIYVDNISLNWNALVNSTLKTHECVATKARGVVYH